LPKNKRRIYRMEIGLAILLHDEAVSRLWPGAQPVAKGGLRDRGLLDSALNRPFQSAFGEDAYPTILQKAAALFHSLVANHCFVDGNKRTAVVALETFLTANDYAATFSDEDIYEVARQAAAHALRGVSAAKAYEEILAVLAKKVMPLARLRRRRDENAAFRELYSIVTQARRAYRKVMTAVEG